ncbi:Lrp/AsnC family transcriptional regulator [Colwellia sp. M166]|nr:Lrp/AsnC family transcriptional regulator [Colwellia sp. M166]
MLLSQLEQDIINRYQKGFPLCSQPYRAIADELNSSEDEVISAILTLDKAGMLSRIGAVFNHKQAGSSTLAALAVPECDLDDIAEIINQFEQVNHNYGREHHYNLWFVVTAHDDQALTDVIANIEHLTGYQVLILPMETSYHIDLAFNIDFAKSQLSSH